MQDGELPPRASRRRLSRRMFLRGALLGGSGLIAAQVAGCDNGEPAPDATPAETMPPAASPAPTPATPSPDAPATPVPDVLRWERLEVSGPLPPPRRDHAMVTDGRRLLVFGGRGAEEYNDVWSLDIESRTWEDVTAAGGPSARFGANAAYDPSRGVMLVFGGQSGPDFFDETWAFDPAAGEWSLPAVGGAPAQRYGSASAMDPSGRFLISHGFTSAGRFDDTWALAGAAWSDVSPAEGRPLERCLMRGAWDTAGERFLMFGGQATGIPFLDDTWEFRDGQGWRDLTADPRPAARNFYAMAFDDQARLLALFGGSTAGGPANDLWVFDGGADTWAPADPDGEAPSPRFGHDMVWVPERRFMLMFGGRDGSQELNDLWELVVPL
jgi:hypothetical protein